MTASVPVAAALTVTVPETALAASALTVLVAAALAIAVPIAASALATVAACVAAPVLTVTVPIAASALTAISACIAALAASALTVLIAAALAVAVPITASALAAIPAPVTAPALTIPAPIAAPVLAIPAPIAAPVLTAAAFPAALSHLAPAGFSGPFLCPGRRSLSFCRPGSSRRLRLCDLRSRSIYLLFGRRGRPGLLLGLCRRRLIRSGLLSRCECRFPGRKGEGLLGTAGSLLLLSCAGGCPAPPLLGGPWLLARGTALDLLGILWAVHSYQFLFRRSPGRLCALRHLICLRCGLSCIFLLFA